MIVGVSKEIKIKRESSWRTPSGVDMLVKAGHRVLVEKRAGQGSGFSDEEYEDAGAELVPTIAEAWKAEMVMKVKEPIEPDFKFFRDSLLLFTYLHLANPLPQLTRTFVNKKVTAITYETVQLLGAFLHQLFQPKLAS